MASDELSDMTASSTSQLTDRHSLRGPSLGDRSFAYTALWVVHVDSLG